MAPRKKHHLPTAALYRSFDYITQRYAASITTTTIYKVPPRPSRRPARTPQVPLDSPEAVCVCVCSVGARVRVAGAECPVVCQIVRGRWAGVGGERGGGRGEGGGVIFAL